MSWRLARAIDQLFKELNAAAPRRSKASDGTIGDASHAGRGLRASDHNPWVTDGRGQGVVTAGDFTDDDGDGADMSKIVTYLTQVSHDKRIKYLIHRGRIYSSYPVGGVPAWAARPYSGPNAHMHHLHVSVQPEARLYDDASSWGVEKALHPKPRLKRVLKVTSPMMRGHDIEGVQRVVKSKVDGVYGPDTAADVKRYQKAKGLHPDGVVGPATAARMGFVWAG